MMNEPVVFNGKSKAVLINTKNILNKVNLIYELFKKKSGIYRQSIIIIVLLSPDQTVSTFSQHLLSYVEGKC